MMKKFALTLAGALILLTVACSQQPSSTSSQSSMTTEQTKTVTANPGANGNAFSGEIMDSMCAGMGGHEQMLQGGRVKNARECTLECVKMGATYVLYNPATKTTYKLDDQKKPAQFAGETVTVNGSLDSATKTIHVENISVKTS